ncbi:ribosomal protein S18-alanine N-acetyltransferase [Hydrogenophaga sp.]|uniref:ribosomal protein S18-alanine N-acetyltransferase n=1 Tax=Hydrogenophaga sp. TaxID=1904254 RepID=UPI00351DDFC8
MAPSVQALSSGAAASGPAWPQRGWPALATESASPAITHSQRRIAFVPMTEADLDAVVEVEKTAYTHPWSRKHFSDSLQSGYPAVLLLGEPLPGEVAHPGRADGRVLLGYLVAMPGVDEVHLLNITVAPAQQRQGWARFMLDALVLWSRGQRAQWLWLEVRHSNTPARALYERYGFAQVGLRRGYYPAGQHEREDAVVMSLNLVVAQTQAAQEKTP